MRLALLLLVLPLGRAFATVEGGVFLPRCSAVIDSVRADAAAMADYSLEALVTEGLAEVNDVAIDPRMTARVEAKVLAESQPLSDATQVPDIADEELAEAREELAKDGGELRSGSITAFRRLLGRPYIFLQAGEEPYALREELDHLRLWRQLREIVRRRQPNGDASNLAFRIMGTVGARLVGEARARCIQFEDRHLSRYDRDPVCILFAANYPRTQALGQLFLLEVWMRQAPRWKSHLWWKGRYHSTIESIHRRERELLKEAAQRTAHWRVLFEKFFLDEAKRVLGDASYAASYERWSTMKPWDRFHTNTALLPYGERLIVEALLLQRRLHLSDVIADIQFTQFADFGPGLRKELGQRFREAELNKPPAELQVAPPTKP